MLQEVEVSTIPETMSHPPSLDIRPGYHASADKTTASAVKSPISATLSSLPFTAEKGTDNEAQKPIANLLQNLGYHLYTAYLFSCSDFDVVCIDFFFGLLNASAAGFSLSHIFSRAPAMVLWSVSNLILFNLHNQRSPTSVAEDAINKPWRPIPSGRLTADQTTTFMCCVYPIALLVVPFVTGGGLLPALLLDFFSCCYNEWGGADLPFMRNLLNGLGFACLAAGPLEVVTGYSVFFSKGGSYAIWLGILATAVTLTTHAQDFRDVEGDRETGRRTAPLVIGDMPSRISVAAGLVASTVMACKFWGVSVLAGWEGAVAWLSALALMANLFFNKTHKGDKLAWRIWPFWVVGLFLLPFLKSFSA